MRDLTTKTVSTKTENIPAGTFLLSGGSVGILVWSGNNMGIIFVALPGGNRWSDRAQSNQGTGITEKVLRAALPQFEGTKILTKEEVGNYLLTGKLPSDA